MPIFIEMPKLSDTMDVGVLKKWTVKEGEKISVGQVIAEIETDKAVMELESFDSGILHKIFILEGQSAEIGGRMAVLLEEGEKAPDSFDDVQPSVKKEEDIPEQKIPEESEEPKQNPNDSEHGERIKISPLARKVAQAKGILLTDLIGRGTGPGGRIVKADVENYVPESPLRELPTNGNSALTQKSIPLSQMRKVVAKRLLESKTQIPHFYLNIEVDTKNLLDLKDHLNNPANYGNLEPNKYTVNDFILKASSQACIKVPEINSSFTEDSLILHGSVDLAVAVAIPDGLITPVIQRAETKTLLEISKEMKDLAKKAREMKLTPEEYQGGTITISNLGAYQIESFQAIINPPMATIISVGGILKKPAVNDYNEIQIRPRMNVGVSCDHRAVDGSIAANFLRELKHLLENPALMYIFN